MNPETSPTSVPGAVILGKYRVERVIGEGGMGFVVEATHLALGHHVAIKVLRNERKDKELVARFEREANIASTLKTDHIARVTDAGKTQYGEPFLVMELLEGRTLDEEIKVRGPLPLVDATDLMLQACRGIAAAHAAGLVHRDIKPQNLFITRRRDGTPVMKVLDFGLTKAPDEPAVTALTSTTTTFGTPQYMSPEQIRSAKFVDARTDQHALGCVFYECLVGKPAYDAETLTALAVQIATRMPDPVTSKRPDLPRAIDDVIFRSIAKEPDDRYPDLAGLALAMVPFGGPAAQEAARYVAMLLRPGSPEAMPNAELPPGARTEAFSLTSAPPQPGVRAWSDPFAVPMAPPSGSGGVDPTAPDEPSFLGRRPPPASAPSQPPQPFATPMAQPARATSSRSGLQNPLFLVGAGLISIFGIWLLFSLISPRGAPAPAAATATVDDEPGSHDDPVPIEQASGVPAPAATQSSAPAQSAKHEPEKSKKRRRHHR